MEGLKENVKDTERTNRENIDSMIKLIQDNDDFMKKVMGVNKKMNSLERKFNQIQEFNLECLVTKRYFNCLSCGSKKINYLPLKKFALGDNARAYQVEHNCRRPDAFVNSSNVFASRPGQTGPVITNIHFQGQSTRSASADKENIMRKMEYRYTGSPFKLSKTVCGKDVFDRDLGQLQHHEKRHVRLEEMEQIPGQVVSNSARFRIKRKRPTTSLKRRA